MKKKVQLMGRAGSHREHALAVLDAAFEGDGPLGKAHMGERATERKAVRDLVAEGFVTAEPDASGNPRKHMWARYTPKGAAARGLGAPRAPKRRDLAMLDEGESEASIHRRALQEAWVRAWWERGPWGLPGARSAPAGRSKGARRSLSAPKAGYTDCSCRDCFDVAIGVPGSALCGDCDLAGCEAGRGECQRPDAYGGGES